MTEISNGLKMRATKAIEAMHDAYFEEGGARDTAAKLETQTEGISAFIYSLAQSAARQDAEQQQAIFGEACAYAESRYKMRRGVTNLQETLPVWPVFKSYILRGMKAGLSPLDFPTERKMRDAVAQLSGPKREQRPPDVPEEASVATRALSELSEPTPPEELVRLPQLTAALNRDDDKPLPQPVIEEFLGATTISDRLRTVLAQIVFSVEHLRSSKIHAAEDILRRTWQELGPLVDQRRVA